MIKIELDKLDEEALKVEKSNKQFFKNLKKKQLRELDDVMQALHEDVFDEINCLDCANCCRSLGPRVTDRDIEKISTFLKIKPSNFISQYLRVDEDKDYVFKTMPCPFLDYENYCMIYAYRPKACREYPHTDRKKAFQIHSLTIRNTRTCPAVYHILERLKLRGI